jgi:hypothetical protein
MAVAAFWTGCLGSDEEPKPATGAPKDIAAVVERFERATAEHDFATVCNRLFTAAARERAGGQDCERLTSSAAEGISRPTIRLKAIQVDGPRASVRVATRASGQAEADEVIELRRESGRWRIEALAD